MDINWNIVATIAAPVIGICFGIAVTRFLESRHKLIAFYGHISAFKTKTTAGQPLHVHSHSVVLRNSGNKPLKNVRLGHIILPDFSVFPDIQYSVNELPGGSKEIHFPTLTGKEQIAVSYLYFPPTTYAQINTHIKSDAGPAKVIKVIPALQLARWQIALLWILIAIGVIALIYLVVMAIRALI